MISESFDNYQKVYNMLEDNVSRDTYMSLLDFLISGDYKYLKSLLIQHYPNMPPLCGQTIPELLTELSQDRGIVLYGTGGGRAHRFFLTLKVIGVLLDFAATMKQSRKMVCWDIRS